MRWYVPNLYTASVAYERVHEYTNGRARGCEVYIYTAPVTLNFATL